jgi:hypothetical protein
MTSHIAALLNLANYSGLLAKKIPRGVYIDTHNLKAMELEDFKIAIQKAAGDKACTIEVTADGTNVYFANVHVSNLMKLAKSSGLIAVVLTSPSGIFIDTDKLSAMELNDFKVAVDHVLEDKPYKLVMEPNYTGGMKVYPEESPVVKKKAVPKKRLPKHKMSSSDQPLYICVSTGYDVQRLYSDSEVVDFEENDLQDMTEGKKLYNIATNALKTHKALLSFMGITRDETSETIRKSIRTLAQVNKADFCRTVQFDEWNPIFQCNTMIEALTMLPTIVNTCRKLRWCNVWKEQEFDKEIKTFPLMNGDECIGTVIFFELEAESGSG